MKTNKLNERLSSGLIAVLEYVGIMSLFLFFVLFLSCSNEDMEAYEIDDTQNLKVADAKLETWQDQIDRLDQKMRRFHNFQVAIAQGWDEDVSGYVPMMGHHFLNADLADASFELLKPEALLYVPDGNGGWEFVAVEYLIFGIGPNEPAPEGFIGNEDIWFYNHNVQAWTLHAWIGLENPAGVFAATNTNVPVSPD